MAATPTERAILLPESPAAARRPAAGDVGPARSAQHPRGFGPRSVVVTLAIVLGALLILALGYLAWHAITWILVAVFLAMALNPAVAALERRGLGRGLAATVVFLLGVTAAGGLAFLLIPPLAKETVALAESLPGLVEELDDGRGPFGWLERRFHVVDRAQRAVESGGAGALLGLSSPILDVARAIIATLFSVLAIAFLTFFMLLDGRRWLEAFLDFVPASSRPRWERAFAGIYRTVGGYVTGNLLISLIAGTVATVTLSLLGIPYALPLGLLVAVLDLVPLVGATLATAVVGAVALTQGVVPAIVVASIMVVYQQIENHVLQPLIYGRSVQLSPLAVLVSVLVGAELAGILGALAAIPIGGSIAVVATELLRWRRETRIETPPGALDPAPPSAEGDSA